MAAGNGMSGAAAFPSTASAAIENAMVRAMLK
jgi:hypothetical protein